MSLRKSTSLSNISAIWLVMLSGMRASSVAAKRVDVTVAAPLRVSISRGTCSLAAVRPCSPRRTVMRVKWVPSLSLSAAGPRAISSCSSPPPGVDSVTARSILPGLPERMVRATGSLRKNADASGSETPSRRSSVSAVSVERVRSLRCSSISYSASASACSARPSGETDSVTIWTFFGVESTMLSGATPKAVTPLRVSTAVTMALNVFG